jgi:hypothetical protein
LGQIIAHIGLGHHSLAHKEFESFSKLCKPCENILFEDSIDSLICYFSSPEGLYKLIVSNETYHRKSENGYEIIIEGEVAKINYQLPFNFYFELDATFAQKYGIKINQYPAIIPSQNINDHNVEKHITNERNNSFIDPFMEELNRRNNQGTEKNDTEQQKK